MAGAEKTYLITGCASGLGHTIHMQLGGVGLRREMSLDDPLIAEQGPFDAIVHCAFNSAKHITQESAFAYFDDNVLLTKRLTAIPHKKFIYISTLDIYPRLGRPIQEDDPLDLSGLTGLYAASKLFSEACVRELTKNHLILRPSALLGTHMRANTTYRCLCEPHTQVFLSADSRYNYVLNTDIAEFVANGIKEDLCGVFNLASTGTVRLGDVAEALELDVRFGDHVYDIGPIDNRRAADVDHRFARESWQTLNLFVDQLGDRFCGTGRLTRPAQRAL